MLGTDVLEAAKREIEFVGSEDNTVEKIELRILAVPGYRGEGVSRFVADVFECNERFDGHRAGGYGERVPCYRRCSC